MCVQKESLEIKLGQTSRGAVDTDDANAVSRTGRRATERQTDREMTTKEELEKSTFVGRNANVWFMFGWALAMFIIDGIVFAVDAPPGESKWEYGPSVFLMCLVRFDFANATRTRCDAR